MNSKVGNFLAIVVAIVCSVWRAILPGCLGALIYRSLWRGGGGGGGGSLQRGIVPCLPALPALFDQVKQVKQVKQSNQSDSSSVQTMVVLCQQDPVILAVTPPSPSNSSVPESSHFLLCLSSLILTVVVVLQLRLPVF